MGTGTLRRSIAVTATVGFAIASLIANLVGPSVGGLSEILDFAAREPGRFVGWNVGLLVSVALLVPAIFGIAQPIRGRGATLAHLGVAVGTLGALGHMSIVTRNVFFQAMAEGPRAEMLALGDRFINGQAVFLFPLIMVYGIGLLLLIAAAWRAGIVPAWVPLIAFAVVVLDLAGQGLLPRIAFIVLRDGLGVLVFAWVAMGLLRLPSTQWADDAKTVSGARAA
jgi:hypothetical protein